MRAARSVVGGRGVLIAIVVCVALAGLAGPGTVAAEEDGPADLPAAYYGDLELNGEPVPADAGVVVDAEVDGEVRGSIAVDEAGVYGSEDVTGDRLLASGDADEDDGAPVTFYVDGDDFDRTAVENTSPETVTWESEAVDRVDLEATVELDPDAGGGGAPAIPPADDGEAQVTPTAQIAIAPDPATVGEAVTFDASASSVAEGELTDFEWEIDGESHAGETVTESVDDAGTVDVELTVTTDAGETDTATDTLTVEAESDPESEASAADDDGALPIPGFGVGVTVVAILGATLFATRRRN